MSLINEYGYAQDIKEYCNANNLSYEKLCSMTMSANDEFFAILYVDPDDVFTAHNEEPAELLLLAKRKTDGIEIIAGKNLYKYCGRTSHGGV